MSSDIPPWVLRRYEILWDAFGDKPFRFKDASSVLMERNKDAWEQVPIFLSELRKFGLLRVESDVKDAREEVYRLKSPKGESEESLGRGNLDALLKKAADLIRTRVDYKFILILLFLKRISDKWDAEFQEAYREVLAQGLSEEEAKAEALRGEYHLFNLPEEFRWESLRKDVNGLTERLSKGLKEIANLNPELKDVVDSVDFVQFAGNRENAEILRQLVELFSEKKLDNVSADVLGDAYEWILRYFAPTKAKEGEIYTPREVIKLLIEILDPKPLESVYDPACGSAGMLISAFKHVEEKFGKEEAGKVFLFGQEANQGILALAKMNMFIHDIRDVHLELGDTLLYPKFKEANGLKQFDVVVANPPWNQDGYDEDVLKKGEFWKQRFGFGFVPKQSADWAWIQHMLASAKDDSGRVGVVVDNGCLFRGGKEKAVRSAILEKDWVECVILLPEKLFYNTSAPGVILIFRKNKPAERKGKILFINASKEFEQHPEVRKLNILGERNIARIVEAYRRFSDEEGFVRVVSLDEVRSNDYSLNVTLYVMEEEEGEKIDIAREWKELKELEKEKQSIAEKLEQYVSEITRALGGQA
ncbi:MAG: type I restriction-modification system subunit M [Metallosphaera sp.]|uniref:class I SAM-dependent DNA methyltransferase n=1 Tax=Metallosphaera sp. TaxID=2020860 RepID=UPI0031653CF8